MVVLTLYSIARHKYVYRGACSDDTIFDKGDKDVIVHKLIDPSLAVCREFGDDVRSKESWGILTGTGHSIERFHPPCIGGSNDNGCKLSHNDDSANLERLALACVRCSPFE
jgi:hypothetical protein